MNYACRIDLPFSTFKSAIDLISEKCERLVVYEHSENDLNIHCHYLLIGCSISTDSIKNYVKRAGCPVQKGNQFWSFKTQYKPYGEDKDIPVTSTFITYMSKGHLEPSYVKGFTQEEIDTYKNEWKPITRSSQPTLKQYIVKESASQSKLRQHEMINEVVRRIKITEDYSAESIIKHIRQVVIVENKTICGRYKIRDYFDTIKSVVTPETWLSGMVQFCTDKINYCQYI